MKEVKGWIDRVERIVRERVEEGGVERVRRLLEKKEWKMYGVVEGMGNRGREEIYEEEVERVIGEEDCLVSRGEIGRKVIREDKW